MTVGSAAAAAIAVGVVVVVTAVTLMHGLGPGLLTAGLCLIVGGALYWIAPP